MDFTTALKNVKMTVDKELLYFSPQKRIEAEKIHPQTVQLVDQVCDFTTRGGKRTRAFLCWLGYMVTEQRTRNSQRGTLKPELLSAMMAIELFQSFALIHDDIIDQDSMRRGSPTVHEKFKVESLKFKVKDANHFGESMAILAGDLVLVWADEMMHNVQIPMTNDQLNRKVKRIVDPSKIYQKMKEEVILGQSLDVLASVGMPSADKATINRYKTAWYSVVCPLQIGAGVAGADEKTINAFVPYGLAVGEGYQLRDDLLDGAISEATFQEQSTMYENQAIQATQAIHASVGMRSLLADFARFALRRQA